MALFHIFMLGIWSKVIPFLDFKELHSLTLRLLGLSMLIYFFRIQCQNQAQVPALILEHERQITRALRNVS